MHKRSVNFNFAVPANNDSSVIAKPGNRAFDFPTPAVSPKCPAILGRGFTSIASMRRNEFNPALFELFSQRIRIIGFITNQALRFLSRASRPFAAYLDRCKRRFDEFRFGRGRRVKGHSQRNTLAVCQYHELCALPPLGFADAWAPFFAGLKLPSMKHSLHWICWRSLSSLKKALQILSQTSCSSQSIKRLQQVLGLGYFSGRSFHRAPVFNTQRIPSTTSRFFFQGRPLLLNWGSNGSIFRHCLTLKYVARLTDHLRQSFIVNHL